MSCFCIRAVAELVAGLPPIGAPVELGLTAEAELVVAASAWLAARWLPAVPWVPDPAWLEIELPEPPLPQASLAVILMMIQAGQTCSAVLGIDLAIPGSVRALVRLIATINLRTPSLSLLAADIRPWTALANLNAQADAVLAAAATGVFSVPLEGPPIGPWRPFLIRLKALAPLIAIGQLLSIDLSAPEAMDILAVRIRLLRSIQLPALVAPEIVLSVMQRGAAIGRLALSFGWDPLQFPIERIVLAVQAKVAAAAAVLPGPILTLPQLSLNASMLATPAVVAAALRIRISPLHWQVPAMASIDLLTAGAPALALAGALPKAVLRVSPCGNQCDAARAL